MEYKFNINYKIKVKLNDLGYQHIIDDYAKYDVVMTKDTLLKRADKDGYTSMQMHSFMSFFGDMSMGGPVLFDLDIIIPSDHLEEVGI